MVEESGEVVRRRGRAEVVRLASLYGTSGMRRSEFCRRHGMSLSTLSRHLKRQAEEPGHRARNEGLASRLVSVELAATLAPDAARKQAVVLTVLLSNGRRVEVGRGFDGETLAQVVDVLERL